jgi:DNA ligase-1
MNKTAIAEGYEGLMVKPIEAIYECKRSPAWLKIKPIIEVTLTVVEVEEGQGKFEGTTGALVCEGVDDGVSIKVNVGSGLTDENREEIWKDKDVVIGQLVEIKADAITQAENGEYSLRFPRFKTFRGFNKSEKI